MARERTAGELRESVEHAIHNDPWAELSIAQTNLELERVKAQAEADKQRREHRHETWGNIWTYIGYLIGVLVAAAIIGFVVMQVFGNMRRNTTKAERIQQERTEQIKACTSLEEPVERQFCLINLNLKATEANSG